MRLISFEIEGQSGIKEGELREGRAVEFSRGSVRERLRSGDTAPADGPSWPIEEVRLLPPLRHVGAIYGVGRNYAGHVAEVGKELPEKPLLFLKPASAAAGPADDVVLPAAVSKLDYEAELAVILGPEGTIAGYAVANDFSARCLQPEPNWVRAKGGAGFCPWGPCIVTADEVDDPDSLPVRLWVNGELRQDGNTAQMLFSPRQVIDFLSEVCELQVGDLILTGTPAGVGHGMDPPTYLKVGDVVRVEIPGLGELENRIVAPGAERRRPASGNGRVPTGRSR